MVHLSKLYGAWLCHGCFLTFQRVGSLSKGQPGGQNYFEPFVCGANPFVVDFGPLRGAWNLLVLVAWLSSLLARASLEIGFWLVLDETQQPVGFVYIEENRQNFPWYKSMGLPFLRFRQKLPLVAWKSQIPLAPSGYSWSPFQRVPWALGWGCRGGGKTKVFIPQKHILECQKKGVLIVFGVLGNDTVSVGVCMTFRLHTHPYH